MIACSVRGGSGRCAACGGWGEVASRHVYYTRCPTCEGDGDVWADGGMRRVTCPTCGGSMEVPEREPRRWECRACGGAGRCDACGGSGKELSHAA